MPDLPGSCGHLLTGMLVQGSVFGVYAYITGRSEDERLLYSLWMGVGMGAAYPFILALANRLGG